MLALVLLLALTIFAAQEPVSTKPNRDVQTEYLKFEDHTLVKTADINLVENRITRRGLTIGAAFGYPGKTPIAPRFVHLTIESTSLLHIFLRETDIRILADGKPFAFNFKAKTSDIHKDGSGPGSVYVSEYMVIEIPTKTYSEIVNSKTVEIQASIYEIQLTDNHLKTLRSLVNAMP